MSYVIKPFAIQELLARAEAVLRRHGHKEPLIAGELVIHRNQPRVEFAGRKVETSLREHAFLELLASAPDHVFSKEELLKRLWEIEFDPQTNVVEVSVARLRRKLGKRGASYIETVINQGYRFRGGLA